MLVLPLAILWFAAVGLALLDGRRVWVGWLAITALGAGLVASGWLAAAVLREGPLEVVAGDWPVGVGIALRADALGVCFAVLTLAVLLVALGFEVATRVRSRTFPALVLFMATGLTGLFLTGDAFNFYVFFELSMIAAYVLTGYGERSRQLRAAMIFAVVNLLGSVLFLIGIAALYHVTGSLDLRVMAVRISVVETTPLVLSGTLLFVAFGVKLGIFPFHFWLPAVYTGTRPSVSAILSGGLANIGTYGLLRFGADLMPREFALAAPALVVLGGASVLYGALQAISRKDADEVLAYSAIGQVGYVLIALGVGGPIGYAGAVLYAVVNSLNKTLLFLAASLRGRLVGAAFVVGAFSVAGVPPAAGFLGKVGLFRTGLGVETATAEIALFALVFLGGALSFVYMFQLFQRRFWEREDGRVASAAGARLLVSGVGIVVVALGLWPEPLLAISERAAAVLEVGAR